MKTYLVSSILNVLNANSITNIYLLEVKKIGIELEKGFNKKKYKNPKLISIKKVVSAVEYKNKAFNSIELDDKSKKKIENKLITLEIYDDFIFKSESEEDAKKIFDEKIKNVNIETFIAEMQSRSNINHKRYHFSKNWEPKELYVLITSINHKQKYDYVDYVDIGSLWYPTNFNCSLDIKFSFLITLYKNDPKKCSEIIITLIKAVLNDCGLKKVLLPYSSIGPELKQTQTQSIPYSTIGIAVSLQDIFSLHNIKRISADFKKLDPVDFLFSKKYSLGERMIGDYDWSPTLLKLLDPKAVVANVSNLKKQTPYKETVEQYLKYKSQTKEDEI